MASYPNGGAGDGADVIQIDEAYEFCAPRFFDFINEETEEEIRRAERWFETSISYAPSPFMPKIKEGRSIKIATLCNFGNVDEVQKEQEPAEVSNQREDPMLPADNTIRHEQERDIAPEVKSRQQQEEKNGKKNSFEFFSEVKPSEDSSLPQQEKSLPSEDSSLPQQEKSLPVGDNRSDSLAPVENLSKEDIPSFELHVPPSSNGARVGDSAPKSQKVPMKIIAPARVKNQVTIEACTPKVQRVSVKGGAPTSTKNLTTENIASLVKKPSAGKPKTKSSKCTKPRSVTKCPGSVNMKNAMATDIAQENQAIKRQKLDDERCRQILNVKTRVLPHKSRPGLTGGTDIFSSGARGCHDDSSLRKEVTPFISTAELVKKFQSRTRDLDLSKNGSLSHDDTASMAQRRLRLTLTRPKEPALETAYRVRAVRVKSSAELEEEMLAKIPKFKARPVNKKILEAPSLPALPRTVPQPPEFQEFHLKTMERANQHAETSSTISSIDASSLSQSKPLKLTAPRPPLLETSLRARPPNRVKSSQELELEELQKIPKFKARPLNKKILESKGDIGLFSNPKPQITTPQEFHFATNDRLGPPATVMELFDKLSLHSEPSQHDKQVPRITAPNPFRLKTEERGFEKERQFALQILQRQWEEETAKVPKANPYPYTTDYPVIPPKPEPKQCTKPEAFQLESLVRHEVELQRKLEEKEYMEREEAQRRRFKAQPIMRDDPVPLPERERKPLTEVQEFVYHADHRAVQRSEFDKKIKEKEIMCKRMREEYETAKMIEEEKAVKQLRRTMVPHARSLPKFDDPFLPQKSTKETTKPKSPELRVNQRGDRRHAFHMR
ncbi:protein TPX2-like isoform X3 [Phoenix dactylifera]|uniref:Protein TPX2-like isoform X3 n=1 Tax=Phoenix dactylifera TaxID=42345 RepID=A0A8B9AQE1_PHODC|nr:protein TPX2-like isoform X3 [Phoenix dactylifera]